jgi:hypothetical protein
MKMVKVLTLLILVNLSSCFGMLADGIHSVSSYKELAQESPAFDSACAIEDQTGSVSQTGVLIAPNIIATAAHGVMHMLQKRNLEVNLRPVKVKGVYVTFVTHSQCSRYEVESVLVDARYTETSGLQAKYDIALIKLKNPIFHIRPAQIFNAQAIPSQALMTVVSFGMADMMWQLTFKRAFRLYECDNYQIPYDDEGLAANRSVLKSSLFFKPNEGLSKPSVTADEETTRVYEATRNWLKDGKKPYALALPGTSGAPVFVRLKVNGIDQDYLLGIVTSFAHLSGAFQAPKGQPEHEFILRHPKEVFNHYQTIFALFYREDNDPRTFDRENPFYRLDGTFVQLFHRIQYD